MKRIEIDQLIRLRQRRLDAALTTLQQCRAELRAADEAIAQRRQRIAQWQARLIALTAQISSQPGRMARFHPLAAAQRAYLDDRLERDEYGLIDDEEEREDVLVRLTSAQAAVAREQARADNLRQLARSARAQAQRRLDARASEAAQTVVTPHGGPSR